MIPPIIHNYSNVCDKILYWDTSDNEKAYLKNLQNPAKKKTLEESGYIDNPIEYRFNSHGFRTLEFDQSFDIVCFGCSFTMGVGIHNEHTWPSRLQLLTGMKVANLGHSGSSNDTAFRMAEHYLKFFKPKYAIWLQTDQHRLEIIDDTNKTAINILASDSDDWFSNNYFIKTWMTSSTNQNLNLVKNTRAFVNLCEELEVKPLILERKEIIQHDLARDLQHPGQNSYAVLALKIKNKLEL